MPSDRDDSIGAAIYVVAIAGVAYLIVILVQLPGGSRRGDFSIYYACAVAMHRGLDPYAINLTDFTRELGVEPDPVRASGRHAHVYPHDGTDGVDVASVGVCGLARRQYLMPRRVAVFSVRARMVARPTIVDTSFARRRRIHPVADNFRWAQSQVFALFGVLLFFRLCRCGAMSSLPYFWRHWGCREGFRWCWAVI